MADRTNETGTDQSTGKPGFPVGARVTEAQLSEDLHETLHQIRLSEPVSWVPAVDGWLVTAYDLAVEALRSPDRFTVEDERFSTARVVGPSMLSTEGSRHRLNRQPFEPLFRTGPVLEASGAIAQAADHLIDRSEDRSGAELRTGFAAPLAVKTISDFLGLTSPLEEPGSEVETRLLSAYREIVVAVSNLTSELEVPEMALAAVDELNTLIIDGCKHARVDGSETFSTMVRDPPMPMDRLLSNTAVILFGAIETCEGMTANALWHLLSDESQWAEASRLNTDKLPDFCRKVVAESLRMEPAAAVVHRYARHPTDLGGITIERGDLVVISLAGASRDPAVFAEPDRFHLDRANAGRHLAFARGPHTCLGIHLARLQTAIALERFLRRIPSGHLDKARSSAPTGHIFRKPQRIAATW